MSSSMPGRQAGLYLYPHQAQFIEKFLEKDAPPHQLLISPVGSGRSIVALALVADAVQRHPDARVLILAPGMLLVEQFRHRLDRTFNTPNVEIINHQRFRELESQVPIGTSPWSKPLVAILSFHIAAQRNILESLSSTNWDLVIIDDFQQFGAGLRAGLQAMLDSGRVQRLLALTPIELREQQPLTSRLHKTTWSSDFFALSGSVISSPLPLRLHLVDYRRGSDEAAFLTELRSSMSQLKQHLPLPLITSAASSSSFALEKLLRRMRDRLFHSPVLESRERESGISSIEVAAMLSDEETTDDLLRTNSIATRPETLKSIIQMLERLDSVSSDEKLNALLTVLKSMTASKPTDHRICIVASFIATTSYLHSALTDEGLRAYAFNGAVAPNTRFDALSTFQAEGGILIATQASLPGVDLRNIDAMFHYDLPTSETWLYLRLAKVGGYGRSQPADVFFFRDQSNALPWESELLARYQLEQLATAEAGILSPPPLPKG